MGYSNYKEIDSYKYNYLMVNQGSIYKLSEAKYRNNIVPVFQNGKCVKVVKIEARWETWEKE